MYSSMRTKESYSWSMEQSTAYWVQEYIQLEGSYEISRQELSYPVSSLDVLKMWRYSMSTSQIST